MTVINTDKFSPANVIYDTQQVAEIPQLYAKLTTLGKIFDLSRSTISNYKNEMLQDEDYAQYVLDVSYNIVLIKITGFEEFLRTNNKKWFKSY